MKKSFYDLVSEASTDVQEFVIFQLKHLIDSEYNFHLIDIREDNELNSGKLKNALHIGRGILDREIESHISYRSDEIEMYCAGGVRSILCDKTLKDM